MIKHVAYPKIGQFRQIVSTINRMINFVGVDENGDAIYDASKKKPVLTARGSVKLHGTNAGVSYNETSGLWNQSRENIINIDNDNFGFSFFVDSRKEIFLSLVQDVIARFNIDTNIYTISIYGEGAGKGIQKGVAISELDKAFYIFGVKISKLGDDSFNSYWLDSSNIRANDHRIFNINDFETYEVEIDFNMPELIQNKLIEITDAVEKECPVAKHFGVSGVGEGVVWSIEYKDIVYRFKVKGDKHSSSKVKKTASVDTEKLNSINEFVDYAMTENRFEQALQKVFGEGELDVKRIGDLMRWLVNDITTEEMDTLIDNNLEPKDVNKYVTNRARNMFFTIYNKMG